MEIPLTKENSIIVSTTQLNGIYSRLIDRVKGWANSANSIQWTLAKNLKNTYKRVKKEDEFQRLNPWHAECIILLSKNGIKIEPNLLSRAIEHRQQSQKITEKFSNSYKVVSKYLAESLMVTKKIQLLSIVTNCFIKNNDPKEQLQYKRVLEMCKNALKSGVIKSEDGAEEQYIKRLTWNIVLEFSDSEDSIESVRNRLYNRCLIGEKILTNSLVSLGAASGSPPQSSSPQMKLLQENDSHQLSKMELKDDETLPHEVL